MSRKTWVRPPLGRSVEMHQGRGVESACWDWRRGMSNWSALQIEASNSTSQFVTALSTSQRSSLTLLVEWWTAKYTSLASVEQMRRIITDHAASSNYSKMLPQEQGLERGRTDDYHTCLFHLFRLELCAYFSDADGVDWEDLQHQRALAARIAACQRLADHTFRVHAGTPRGERRNVELIQNSCAEPRSLPVGGTIEACPWLPERQKQADPFFLWDVEQRQTVVVSSLRVCPSYAVVSHTWGRWKNDDASLAQVPGVPWLLPRNTRFDVEQLPAILESHKDIFAPAKYVWFDLLCIPQDRSSRAKEEIAKQAAIFGGASRAYAWLNYVEDWDGFSCAIEFMLAKYLDKAQGRHREGDIVRFAMMKRLTEETHLFEEFRMGEDESWHFIEGGWFSSLWTLQEALLRPDMLLCDREWNILSVPPGDDATPTPIDTLCAIFHTFSPHIGEVQNYWERPVADAIQILNRFYLDQTLQINPISLLTLGSRRECIERRAEAIMNVVGCTKWYQTSGDAENENDLVLGKYPIAFLRELHEMFGAQLFSSNYLRCCYKDVFRAEDPIKAMYNFDVDRRVAGTMLPFERKSHHESRLVRQALLGDMVDHPSTSTWSLADDGRIVMPEVGIAASTHPRVEEGTDAELQAVMILPEWTPDDQEWGCSIPTLGDLHQGIRQCFPGLPGLVKHAVVLSAGLGGTSEGVILMSVPRGRLPTGTELPTLYAKIGDFFTPRQDALADTVIPVRRKSFMNPWEVL